VTKVRSDLSDTDYHDEVGDSDRTGGPISDAELTALALACDPNQPLDPDATPLDLYPDRSFGLLPRWYMPPVTAIGSRRWRTPVVVAIIAAFLLIDAFGLCITYGQLIAA
jgi:hypothetical protein